MARSTFAVEKRDQRNPRQLRRDGSLPATVYAKDIDSISIQFNARDFTKLYHEVGNTNVIDLDIPGQKSTVPVLVQQIQYDYLGDTPIHIEFHKINLKEKTTAIVPLEYVGISPAEKLSAYIQHELSEVEVECLPNDIPDKIEVDISVLKEIGDQIAVSDLKPGNNVEILTEAEELVVRAVPALEQAEEEEEVGEVDVEAQPEVINEKKAEEKK